MADVLLLFTIMFIIGVFCYVISQFDKSLDYFKIFLLLMIIPLMYAMIAVGHDLGRNCALVYDSNTNTLTQLCATEPHQLWVWLLKIFNALFYFEIVVVFFALIYAGFNYMTKKGSYAK